MLDMHEPVKKFSKQKLEFRKKTWITFDLQISVSIKNNLLTKYIRSDDLVMKAKLKLNIKNIETYCALY